MKRWLEQLPAEEQKQIILHSHWSLADEFELKGLHFGASVLKDMRTEEQQDWWLYAKKKGLTISSSVHDQEEIHRLPLGVDEVWLSPIYESISKAGYQAAFTASQFDTWTKNIQQQKQAKVFALGGVKAEHLNELKQRGFYGAVALGTVWKDIQGLKDKEILKQRIEQLIALCQTNITS
ncbi:MAG: thiamine phosphate synthase [Chitinophagaceae bacterium]|nr:thiamine phosphate synthase [Chitinophagaceae bacterium]